jgi:uncharacterized membrane protein YczE
MLALYRRTGLRLGKVRWGMEVGATALGILLGGAFGVGTIIFAMLVGFAVDFFFTHLHVRVGEATPGTRAAQVAGAD